MNNIAKSLLRTKRTLLEVCEEFGIDIEDAEYGDLETCSNCSVWLPSKELIPDLDFNPICKYCKQYYGM